MRKIIGVCGFISSGKGTVGDILVENHGFTKLSFADRLKDGAATIFNWDRKMLEGDTKESRAWREAPDPFWTKELGYEMSPRLALQLLGTDCMRHGFNNDIWVLIAKRHLIENPDTNFVIPDVRFHNERNIIRELKGEVWQVRRGEQPEWIDKAISDNRYDTNWMDEFNVHESEWRWLDHASEFERTILNEGSLEDLRNLVARYIA